MTAGTDFHDVLDAAIRARGLTLDRIRHHLRRRGLDISPAMLSYWRRGLSRPRRAVSMQVVEALEGILEVPAGTLIHALDRLEPPDGVAGNPEGLGRLAKSLGLDWDDGLRRHSIQDRISLDAEGRPLRHHVRENFVARREGVSRFPAAYQYDEVQTTVTYRAGENCEIGRTATEDLIVVAEIVMPRPLSVGEVGVVDYVIDIDGVVEPMDQWGRYAAAPVRDLHFTVLFHPDKVPLRAEAVTEVDGHATSVPVVLTGPSIDVHRSDFGPGVLELLWTWCDEQETRPANR